MSQPHPSERTDRSAPASSQADADALDFERFIAGQVPVDVAAAGWAVRRQDGLTPEEEAELQEWLAADPEHARALEQLDGIWGGMADLPQDGIDTLRAGVRATDASLGAVVPARVPAQAIPAPPRHEPPRRPARQAWGLGRWMPTLATAALVCLLAIGGWQGWSAWQAQPIFSQSYATLRGQQREIRLPDGSTLWLDTATQADVTLYRQRREVRLSEGQAQFAVHADARQPFDVLAGPLRITVVGTRFSVRHTHTGLGDGGVSVVVDEGRVSVARADQPSHPTQAGHDDAVELTAGQSIASGTGGKLGPIAQAPAGTGTAWREGRISFAGTTLAQALAEFERYGDTHLRVPDPAIAALRIHGSFDLRRIDAFGRALPKVLPVQLRQASDGHTEIVGAPGH